MIEYLSLSNVGPASKMELQLGKRLNILTGDNGLGKSFLLDIIWWAMTRKWPAEGNSRLTAGKVALPTDKTQPATITASFSAASRSMKNTSHFDRHTQSWPQGKGRPANPGLIFYAMADGSFAVWDPARNYWKSKGEEGNSRPAAYVFSPAEVWDGLQNMDGTWLCNGLIRDWASWQKENGQAFTFLKKVLASLSPSEEEKLIPGALTRISLNDARDMPTLKMPYDQDVAIVHASSGMRRIMALAYFLVWCQEEHVKAKKLLGEAPETRVVFLVDEVEAHLHPKWQRTVIPALMHAMQSMVNEVEAHLHPKWQQTLLPEAMKSMKGQEKIQLIVATHSPLVMASIETLFDTEKDAWFDLDLAGHQVTLTQRPFTRRGDSSAWLTSDAFDLKSGYSKDAEQVLEDAFSALKEEHLSRSEAWKLHKRLRSVLSDVDPFWIRWRFVATKKGWLS